MAARPSRKPTEAVVEAELLPEPVAAPEPAPPETRWSLWGDLEG